MQKPHTILITGAGGFLGSQAVEKALEEGHRVVAVVHGEHGKPFEIPADLRTLKKRYRGNLEIESVELAHPAEVAHLFDQHPDVDVVLHMAANLNPCHDTIESESSFLSNVKATENVAEYAQQLGRDRGRVIHFHYTATSSVLLPPPPSYGRPGYGDNKRMAVEYLREHQNELHNLDIAITYPINLIGPKESKSIVTRLFRQAKACGRWESEILDWYKANGFEEVESRPIEMTHSANYLQDIFSCFAKPALHGLKEYRIDVDYATTVGDVMHRAMQAVGVNREGVVPPTLNGQYTPYKPNLPVPPDAPAHYKYDLSHVLKQQCAATIGGRQRN